MGAALAPLRVPLQALLVALGGVGLAWLYFHELWWAALLAVAAGALLGVIANVIANARLPAHPVSAVYFFEGWLLIPIALAVLAAAVVVVVTVELTVPETVGVETKKLVGGVSTGITTFLTSAFISWTGDDQDSTLANHIRDAFQGRYTRESVPKEGARALPDGSAGELWVFAEETEGVEGWGRPARLKRAHGIAEALKPAATPSGSARAGAVC